MKYCEETSLSQILAPGSGRNIVFSLTDLADYPRLLTYALPLAQKAGLSAVFLRFIPDDADRSGPSASVPSDASLPELLPDEASFVRTIPIPLNHRFQHFTVTVQDAIAQQPEGTLFLFDCLSDLETAWATDLMMVNFFSVITPLLTGRGCTAYFPLKAGMHSDLAAHRISDISDVFLDVCSDFKNIYVRAEQIRDKTDALLFQPHLADPKTGDLQPITDGVKLSRYHRAQDISARMHPDLSMDSWDRFFLSVQRRYEYGADLTEDCFRMCRIMMSRDLRMRSLILEHFRPEDYFFVKEHMVGSGQIGGKACGMLTARRIIENRRPDLYDCLEADDSFFIGSDVFTSYIVNNGLWDLSVRQRTEEGYFEASQALYDGLRNGSFWPRIEEQFSHLLDYYGHAPVIVRSSSILEDGFDNAFAGKYDSVFVPNTGTEKERLSAFEDAVKTVYASTMSLSALDYRKRRGLAKRDEQMAILVMRVSGSHYGSYYLPCAAGVGYSCSPYRFLPTLRPDAGMLRLVMGLGTAAVDRTEGAYPRLVSLDDPQATPYHTSAQKHRYSQRKISVIDKTRAALRDVTLEEIEDSLPVWLRRILLEHDTQAEHAFRERGVQRDIEFISCRGIVRKKELMDLMDEMIHQLEDSYGQSVDIEFTINLSEDGDFVVNLLQCRPLQVLQDTEALPGEEGASSGACPDPGTLPESAVLLETVRSSMGMSRSVSLDGIVYIDPVAYYELPYSDKPKIGRSVGQLNWSLRDAGKTLLLLTPGRIGTSSPELGVPAAFSDISSFSAICELSESRAGYQPELSYGSHIFQDLVEANILYGAVFEDERRIHFRPESLGLFPDRIREIVPDADDSVIHYYEVSDGLCRLIHDMKKEHLLIFMPGKVPPGQIQSSL